MTKSKKGIVLVIGVITILLTLFSQNGCNDIDEAYISRLDSLDNALFMTEKYLSIDYATIHSREESIAKDLKHINKYYDKTLTESFGNNLTKYKGIKKSYTNFLNLYPGLFDEMKSLKKQAADLRISVTKGDINKEDFKKFYRVEKKDISDNQQFAKNLSQSIHALEPEYQRLSRAIEEELNRIALIDPEFQSVLTRDSLNATR
jgi:hypothetical protein